MSRGPSINALAFAYISSKSEKDFKNLFDRLKPGLLNYSNKILKDQDSAEDVVADAFTKIWNKIDTYNPRWSFSTWCYKIVSNETMQHIRNSKKKPESSSHYSLSTSEPGFADMLLNEAEGILLYNSDIKDFTEFDTREMTVEELYEKVIQQINELPEHYKNIMIDREVEHMQYNEIADKYNLEINTVKTRIIRAREKVCSSLNINRSKLTKI